jgi:biopolymer transport protein ExbB/TolQ
MMIHLKKYWLTYLLAIAVAILLYFLLFGNKPIESHRTEADQLNKDYKALQDSLTAASIRDKMQAIVIITQDSSIRAIRQANEATRRELDKSKSNSQRLASEIKSIQPEDTSVYAHKVDELITENKNLIWLNDQYVAAVDSLNIVVDKQKSTYEQRLTDKASLINDMSKAAEKNITAYNGLNKDYERVSKSLKREKLKTKGAALIALAAIVYGFVK